MRNEKTHRTVHQIVDKKGDPHKACHTEPLWVDRTDTDVFATPTDGNKIVSFTTGKEYFADLIVACDTAASEIYIAGWQVNWDALLAPGVRLYDVLLRAATRGVAIYVMPWNDSEPVQTYDDQTKVVLEHINEVLKLDRKASRVRVHLCPSFANLNNGYFSHHQKQVVIDRKIAYVGGIDLAYGRLDDATFNLQADADGREMLNRYNPGIPPLQQLDVRSSMLVDPDLMLGMVDNAGIPNPFGGQVIVGNKAAAQEKNIAGKGWQIRYAKAAVAGIALNRPSISANAAQPTTLDPSRQPRMPWQDLHCRVEGPAVSDLLRNFIVRWNATSSRKMLPAAPPPAQFSSAGKAHIQVLRSAPASHCRKENGKAAGKEGPGSQQDIHIAMLNLIDKARRFIYIENQFFVSDFGIRGGETAKLSPAGEFIKTGPDGIGDAALRAVRVMADGPNDETVDRLPQNRILKAMLKRLQEVIVDDITKPNFHIYITLPVHPEGALSDPSIAVQVYFTMQTLVFGSHSLINGIRRLIKARKLKDKKDPDYLRVFTSTHDSDYADVPVEACDRYITLLNLRNWTKLGDRYVTEQIYVHSKLMIVDDRFALLGSANINDRSLLGERDSELAVLVMDDDTSRADIHGKGSNQPVRIFAHELRKKVWSKLLGITGGVRPASHLQKVIEEPGNPASWKALQGQARSNAILYDSAFAFIPRNFSAAKGRTDLTASIIPTFDPTLSDSKGKPVGALGSPMPYQDIFWNMPMHLSGASKLESVRGYVTALPTRWTENEFLGIRYPTALIVQHKREKAVFDAHNNSIMAASSEKKSPNQG